jgi:hypothetical protein
MADAAPSNTPLFLDFFYLLREAGLPVSTWEWLTFMEALSKGLAAASLHRMYALARATLIKDEKHYDRFDQAFAYYFGGNPLPHTFKKDVEQWLQDPLPIPQLTPEQIEALNTYNLDELRKMFEERLEEQNERHDGGSKWIGTGGTSPFGHGGVHPGGIRVGGSGGSRSAVQIAAKRRFRAYRRDLTLDVRQLSIALRRLRRLGRDGRRTEVDITATIAATARNAGDLEIAFSAPRENRLKVLLMMDVGGSMDPFALLVSRLFSAAHSATHFHEFHALYFHNAIYEQVFRDAAMTDALSTKELMRWLPKDTRVIYVGDAHMAPYELTSPYGAIDYWHQNPETGLTWLNRLKAHFSHHAWLNPIGARWWNHPTIRLVGEVFPMFELTLDGLDQAIAEIT